MSTAVAARAETLFRQHLRSVAVGTDRTFGALLVGQWVFGIVLAIFLSPYTWAGGESRVHVHVWAAVLLGGTLTLPPLALIFLEPASLVTRHVIAAAQVLWSALLIHLSGGRIETHFHIFGSLAFLAAYRDWPVLVTASAFVVADHLLRGLYWPESIYGISTPEWWRFLEHAGWVVFEDVVLVAACLRGVAEAKQIAVRQAEVEALSEAEAAKSRALDEAMEKLRASQDAQVKAEKLAAIGQLAAGVGHELRNPLAAIRNAHAFIEKRLAGAPAQDPRVAQFLGVIDREGKAMAKIVGEILDFARERPPVRAPCPLGPLVDEAIGLVPPRAGVAVTSRIPADLPVPSLDKEQFRQILVNLVQNAVEAMPDGRQGSVVVAASGGGDTRLELSVTDDGAGMPPEVAAQIFQPLFTTKTKGTGLGLAIVANLIARHDGTIRVESEPGKGARFVIELPPAQAQQAA